MTTKIHHNTAKRAARLGLEFQVNGDQINLVSAIGKVVATGTNAKEMLDALVAKYDAASHNEDEEGEGQDDAEGDVEKEGEEGDEDEFEGKSIVKAKYKQAYRPFRSTCGDDMARAISTAIKVVVTITLPSGKQKKVMRIDPKRLQRLARMNGVWSDEYLKLNVGQQRMNVGNRIRKLAKDGVEIKGL